MAARPSSCCLRGLPQPKKFVARQRFLRELRISRITVDELKQKIDARENSSSLISATPWTSKLTRKPFPALSAWIPRTWKRRMTVCRVTAKSFSTVT